MNVKKIEDLQLETEKNLKDFNDLLDSLSSTEEQQKSLWRQIYQNAITDRSNAYLAWSDLYTNVHGRPTDHAIHGQNLSRYMERMSKANDQLIKLAELVSAAKEKDSSEDEVSEEDLYNQLEKSFVAGTKQ